jgi:hypothetical protein
MWCLKLQYPQLHHGGSWCRHHLFHYFFELALNPLLKESECAVLCQLLALTA